MRIYTKEQFEKYKNIFKSCERLADSKLERTQKKGLCFWCETEKAEFPHQQPQACVNCWLNVLIYKLEEVKKFGVLDDLNKPPLQELFIAPQQLEKNKNNASKMLVEILKDKIHSAKKYEKLIFGIIRSNKDFYKFFEEN